MPQGNLAPDVVARAAKVRPLVPNEIYAGIVTSVGRTDAVVELAPAIAGNVPFSTMIWARPFKPERATPRAEIALRRAWRSGDVVAVRVAHLATQRTRPARACSGSSWRWSRRPRSRARSSAIDLKTRGVLALAGGYDLAHLLIQPRHAGATAARVVRSSRSSTRRRSTPASTRRSPGWTTRRR